MTIKHAHNGLAAILTALMIAAIGCRGSNDGWNGNWKLNRAKSRVQGGADFTLTISPDGAIRSTNDAFDFNFRCDGKEYPNPNGSALTTSCIQVDVAQWKLTHKRNNAVSSQVLWDVSRDGTTLTIHGKSSQPDGSDRAVEHIYHRSGEGSGFAGRWQAANPFDSRPTLLNLSVNGNSIHFAYPQTDQYVDAPLDGTIAPLHTNPRERQGFTMSIRRDSPLQLHTELSFEGRVIREGTLRLSDDGHTIVTESWTLERLNERDSFVYEKQ